MNVEIGAEAAQFPEMEYINGIAVAVCDLAVAIHGVLAEIVDIAVACVPALVAITDVAGVLTEGWHLLAIASFKCSLWSYLKCIAI